MDATLRFFSSFIFVASQCSFVGARYRLFFRSLHASRKCIPGETFANSPAHHTDTDPAEAP